jgi:elongation factor G
MGQKIFNTNKEQFERSMKVLRVTAGTYEDAKEVKAGDIAAAVGLRHTSTGDTLVGDKDPRVRLAGLRIPDPVFFCSITAESVSKEDELKAVLNSIQLEDPSFRWTINKDTGQWTMSGMGELHLEIIRDKLTNHYKVPYSTGPVSIAYRSTLESTAESKFTRSYETSPGKHETAGIIIKFEPLERGSGTKITIDPDIFNDWPQNKKLRAETMIALQEGLQDALRSGVPAGFPLSDVEASITGIQYVAGTSPNTYRIAVLQATYEAVKEGGVELMEPIMKVEIVVDDKHVGSVMADLTSRRRGRIETMNLIAPGKMQVDCFVPLKELMGYSTELRSQTKGSGSYSMDFDNYETLSKQEQKNVLETMGYFEFVQ